MDRPESAARILWISLVICLGCSLVVSSAALYLTPLHRENVAREQRRRMLEILESQPGLAALLERDETVALETRLVDLATGHAVRNADAAGFDQRAAARDPERSIAIPEERDLAGLERRARRAPVFEVRHGGRLEMVILPIHGQGYGGLIYGYLALGPDANTVVAITFYEHEETPGIGADIEKAAWRDLWRGKRLHDAEGRMHIQVDAISGATYTSEGVTNMVRFWMGDDGFGPYLRRVAP